MYTRRGDRGETGLYGAKRAAKDSARVEAYGTIDELNSFIGASVAICRHEEMKEDLKWLQSRLFVAGADLATDLKEKGDRVPRIAKGDTETIERKVDVLLDKIPRLTSFILPGGSGLSASLHVARAVCRRAERRLVTLGREEEINPELVPFMNRASTYLFNAARYANVLEHVGDDVWNP